MDLNDANQFLPCVSCLNEKIMSGPTGNKTLVFTNANDQVSTKIETKDSQKLYLTNACTEAEFLATWKQCDKVITNSYHGIYWSLLSGRSVAPYGYSSKFINATAMFGIEFPVDNLYTVTSRSKLTDLINRKQTFISAKEPKLEYFQALNLSFAASLETRGISCIQKFQ
jgi:hypothetical protein